MNSILIGKIVNVHGIKGEFKVYTYTDDISNLAKKKEIYFDKELKDKHIVSSCKIQNNMLIMKVKDINDVDSANKFRNVNLYIPKEEIVEEDTYYIEDLIGIDVVNVINDCYIGKIIYVFNTGANDIYEVELEDGKKAYLPAIKQVVKKVDLIENKMYIELMDGLI